MNKDKYINRPESPSAMTASEYNGDGVSVPGTIREISITQLDRGYVVRVGCKTFAIENATDLLCYLTAYIHNPAAAEAEYNNGKLFR